jgi:hypothetical protein
MNFIRLECTSGMAYTVMGSRLNFEILWQRPCCQALGSRLFPVDPSLERSIECADLSHAFWPTIAGLW